MPLHLSSAPSVQRACPAHFPGQSPAPAPACPASSLLPTQPHLPLTWPSAHSGLVIGFKLVDCSAKGRKMLVEAVIEHVAWEKLSTLLLEGPFVHCMGGQLISLHTKTAECQGGHAVSNPCCSLESVPLKANLIMEIQVRERRGGRRKVNGGESGIVPGPREVWVWVWVGREPGLRLQCLLSCSYITSSSHSLRAKLTHSHACFPPSPGSS